MAISVDPQTFVITVPKADTTLVQVSPTEIRQLDLNLFRLQLKDWEDDGIAGGITFLRTHTHNTEVLLGGITYARVIEILPPYTITFEDGQYAVNLVGANSNVGDRVNVNQVSVRSSNSAGLISNSAIEFSSFNGGVTIDIANISEKAVSGTTFPAGTPQAPVNNISDLKLIASFRGFNKIYIIGNLTVGLGDDFSRFIFEGESPTKTTITVEPAANVLNCEFTECTVSGTLDGNSEIFHARVSALDFVDGKVQDSDIGPQIIKLGTSTNANFFSCFSTVPGSSTPVIDMNGTGILGLRDYNGGIELRNYNGNGAHSIDMSSGQIKLDPNTITSGTFVCRGVGKLIDTNGIRILTGIWNGGVNIVNEMINLSTISEATSYNDAIHISTSGRAGTTDPIGVERDPVNNLADAITLSVKRGTNRLVFMTDFTFGATDSITGYDIWSNGNQYTTLTFTSGCVVAFCEFHELTLTGNLTGVTGINDCIVRNLGSVGLIPSSQTLTIKRSYFSGTITLPANYSGTVVVVDCYSDIAELPYTQLDMGNSTANLIFRNYSGQVEIANMTQGNFIDIAFTAGEIKLLTASVTSGIVHVLGAGKIESWPEHEELLTGIWNGGVQIYNESISGIVVENAAAGGIWTEPQRDSVIQYSKKASDNAEQANLKL